MATAQVTLESVTIVLCPFDQYQVILERCSEVLKASDLRVSLTATTMIFFDLETHFSSRFDTLPNAEVHGNP